MGRHARRDELTQTQDLFSAAAQFRAVGSSTSSAWWYAAGAAGGLIVVGLILLLSSGRRSGTTPASPTEAPLVVARH